ncbi:MAG: hypothetical protein ACLTMP_10190 [Eggerthella lenta]
METVVESLANLPIGAAIRKAITTGALGAAETRCHYSQILRGHARAAGHDELNADSIDAASRNRRKWRSRPSASRSSTIRTVRRQRRREARP